MRHSQFVYDLLDAYRRRQSVPYNSGDGLRDPLARWLADEFASRMEAHHGNWQPLRVVDDELSPDRQVVWIVTAPPVKTFRAVLSRTGGGEWALDVWDYSAPTPALFFQVNARHKDTGGHESGLFRRPILAEC